MKLRKLLSLLLAAAILLGLWGCGKKPAVDTQPTDTTQQTDAPTEPVVEEPTEPVEEVGVRIGDMFRFSTLAADKNGENGVSCYTTGNGKTLTAFESYKDGIWSSGDVTLTPQADTLHHLGEATTADGTYVVVGYEIPATGAVEVHTRTILDSTNGYTVQLAQGTPDNIIGSHKVVGYNGTDYRYVYSLKVTEGEMLYLLYKPQSNKTTGFRFSNFVLYTGVGEGCTPTDPVNDPLLTVVDNTKLEIRFTDLVGKNNGMNGLTFYYTADGKKLNPLSSYDAAEGKWYKGGDGVLVYPCLVKKDNYGLFGSSTSEYIVMGYKLPASGNINLFTWAALQSGHDYRIMIAKGDPQNVIANFDVKGESQTVEYRNTTLDVKRGDVLYIHYLPLEKVNGAWGGFNTSILYNSGGEDYQVFDPNGFEAPENAVGTSIPFTTLVEPGKNGAGGLTFHYTEDGKVLTPFTDYVEAEGKWYHGADGTLLYPGYEPAANYGLVGSSSGEYVALEYVINQKGTIDVYNWFALQSGHDYQVQVAKNSPENILYVMDVKGESQTVVDKTVTMNVNKGDKLYILYKPLEAENGAWGGYKAQITWVAVNEHTGPKDPDPIKPEEVKQPDPVQQPDLNDGVTKVLAIGNSFTVDTMEYVKKLAASAGVNNVQLGKIVIGGANLNNHANNAKNNAANYEYGVSTADGGWYTVYNQTMADVLMDENWDYVVIQQNSSYAGQESGFTKLNDLLTYIETYSHKDTEIVYNMTWAYQQNSTHVEFPWYDKDQTKMYKAITDTTQSVVASNSKVDMILSTGTAVQNARTSYVGDTLTLDGYHMSRDQGRYVVAMAFAKTVLGLDLSTVTYTPAGVSDTFRQMAAEAADNAYAKPYQVTNSTFTTAPEDEVRRETLNFADMASAVNSSNGLTFYYTADGVNLTAYTLYDESMGRWYDNTDNQLNLFDPAEVKANNYGLGQCSATKYVAMGYTAAETGSLDLFNLTVIQGPAGTYTYNVRVAKNTPDNVLHQYTFTGTPGVSQEERYTVDVEKGDEIYLIYELTEGKELGGWFGYRNTVTFRNAKTDADPEPEYSVQIGQVFKSTELMPTGLNGEKGMYIYQTADGKTLGDFTGYAPDVHFGRWFYSVNNVNATFIDPFCDLSQNYGWAGASSIAYPVMAYKMPEPGKIRLTNWLATHTGQACELMIAVGTPENVVKTFSVSAPNGWQESAELVVAKDELVYIHFKPVNPPATADQCYFGYKTEYTYTALGEFDRPDVPDTPEQPETAVKVGDVVKFADISSLTTNGENGLTMYYTSDGRTLTPYTLLDAQNGAWYELTDEKLSKFNPKAEPADNYGVTQTSTAHYTAIGYQIPETGTIDLYTWLAMQSDYDFQLRIAKGTPDNILYTYDIAGASQTIQDQTTTLNVTKDEMLYLIFKSTEVQDGAVLGYKAQITWKSVGTQNGPADPDKIVPDDMKEPEYSVAVGQQFLSSDLASTGANGANGLYYYYTTNGTDLVDFTGYDPNTNTGRWYYTPDNATVPAWIEPFAVKADNYGQISEDKNGWVVMGYKMPEPGKVSFTNWVATHSGGAIDLLISIGTPGNVVKKYTVDATNGWQEAAELTVAKNQMVYVSYKPTTTNTCLIGYNSRYQYTALGDFPAMDPLYSVSLGQQFLSSDLASTGANGANGLYYYYTTNGTDLVDFTGYDPNTNTGRWYYTPDNATVPAWIEPFAVKADNYGQISVNKDGWVVMGYKMPEPGKISFTNWLATHSGGACKLMMALGTPDNVVKSYTVDATGGWQESVELTVAKNQMLYVIYKPNNANDCLIGYKADYKYLTLGQATVTQSPYAVKVGQSFRSYDLASTGANGEKGLYFYYTPDGTTPVSFTGYAPTVNNGRWYYTPDNIVVSAWVEPFGDSAANYGRMAVANSGWIVMGYQMPEAGTVHMYNWMAQHSGKACNLSVYKGGLESANLVAAYQGVNGVIDHIISQTTGAIHVQKGEMIYVAYQPVETAEAVDGNQIGYQTTFTYTAVG